MQQNKKEQAADIFRTLFQNEVDKSVELIIKINELENENKALKEENEILNNKLEYQDKVDDWPIYKIGGALWRALKK